MPGPDGAMATAMLELLAQGVQEAEIRCYVEKMLAAGTAPGAFTDFYEGIQRYDAVFNTGNGNLMTDPAVQKPSARGGLTHRGYGCLLSLASALQESADRNKQQEVQE
jgi:hypothetical protein